MPINPQIVTAQLPGIQIENPMTFARNALAMKQAQSEIEANQLAAQEAGRFNALIAASQKPDGAPITRDLLIRQGLYKRAKELQEAENALATGEKTKLDVIGSAMDTSSRLLDTVRTPQEMMAWHEANHADPVLGSYLAARGITAEQSRAKIAAASQDPAAFQQLLLDSRLGLEKSREQHFIEQEYGGGTRVLGMSKYGGPARVVEGSDIAVTPSPNRPITTIDMSKKFSDVLSDKAATQFDNLYTKAQSAESSLNLSARLKPLLANKDFISGTLGNTRLAVAKALDLPGAEETQAYFSAIGGQVAEIIKNFGAGTGLSDKDREFAEKIAGGSIELTPAAIKRIVALNDEASKFVLNKYNKRRSELSTKNKQIGDYYPEVRAVVRTGTLNGRKVVQYQDGTTEYAD
jgi:hypothetical protein